MCGVSGQENAAYLVAWHDPLMHPIRTTINDIEGLRSRINFAELTLNARWLDRLLKSQLGSKYKLHRHRCLRRSSAKLPVSLQQ